MTSWGGMVQVATRVSHQALEENDQGAGRGRRQVWRPNLNTMPRSYWVMILSERARTSRTRTARIQWRGGGSHEGSFRKVSRRGSGLGESSACGVRWPRFRAEDHDAGPPPRVPSAPFSAPVVRTRPALRRAVTTQLGLHGGSGGDSPAKSASQYRQPWRGRRHARCARCGRTGLSGGDRLRPPHALSGIPGRALITGTGPVPDERRASSASELLRADVGRVGRRVVGGAPQVTGPAAGLSHNDDDGRRAQDDEVAGGGTCREQHRDEHADAGDDQTHTAVEASSVGVETVDGPGDLRGPGVGGSCRWTGAPAEDRMGALAADDALVQVEAVGHSHWSSWLPRPSTSSWHMKSECARTGAGRCASRDPSAQQPA